MHMIPMMDSLGIPMLLPNPMMPVLMHMMAMIYRLRIPNSMMPMIMAVLVSMMVMLLLLLLFKLCFGGWLEPCLIDLHIHGVLGASSVALPDMLLVKGHPIQRLLWQLLHAELTETGGELMLGFASSPRVPVQCRSGKQEKRLQPAYKGCLHAMVVVVIVVMKRHKAG